jgi:hypothetical protein
LAELEASEVGLGYLSRPRPAVNSRIASDQLEMSKTLYCITPIWKLFYGQSNYISAVALVSSDLQTSTMGFHGFPTDFRTPGIMLRYLVL